MEKIVAKLICGPDADSMYGRNEEDPGLCPICKTRIEMIPNPNYRVRIKGRDFQNTYDGFYIVSDRFKQFCEQNGYSNLLFTPTKTKGFYTLLSQNIYKTSCEKGITRSSLNNCCSHYSHVYTLGRFYVRDKDFIQEKDDFIARTEFMYGDNSHKRYELIIGNATFAKMKEHGLKVQYLADVCSMEYYLEHEVEFIEKREETKRFLEEQLRKIEEYERAHRWDFLINLPRNIIKGILSLFKKPEPEIVYRFGKARPMDKVTLKNMQRYPIWMMEYVETDSYEDNWTKPFLDTCNVVESMGEVDILMKEEEREIHVSATLDARRMRLTGICRWNATTRDWEAVNPVTEESARQWKLKAVPLINGEENVTFAYNEEEKVFKGGK